MVNLKLNPGAVLEIIKKLNDANPGLSNSFIESVVRLDDGLEDIVTRSAMVLILCYFLKSTLYDLVPRKKNFLTNQTCIHVALALQKQRLNFEFI